MFFVDFERPRVLCHGSDLERKGVKCVLCGLEECNKGRLVPGRAIVWKETGRSYKLVCNSNNAGTFISRLGNSNNKKEEGLIKELGCQT